MTWQNQQNGCVSSEDSDQPGHPPSLIRVFAVCMKKPWVLSYPLSTQRRLIRLGGCPGWSESSLGAHSFCWFCHVMAHIKNFLLWSCMICIKCNSGKILLQLFWRKWMQQKQKEVWNLLYFEWYSIFELVSKLLILFLKCFERLEEHFLLICVLLAHLSRRLTRWAYRMGLEPACVRACVRASVRACVHTFKHEYLRDQQADYNQILSEASLGWGKGCIRFWCRSDQNSCFHGNG